MSIDAFNPLSHYLITLDKEKEFIQSRDWNHREGMKSSSLPETTRI